MDSFELNKIMGAILGTCLGVLSLNIAANAVFSPSMPKEPGYRIDVPEKKGGGPATPAQPDPPVEALLADASVERGKSTSGQCIACHTFEKGGPNRVGPNLYGIVGRQKASHAGFNYSAALKKMSGSWTFQELYEFVKHPKVMVPGTNMTFGGIARPATRADLLVFLNTQSDSPQPLPKAPPPEAKAAQPEAKAAQPEAKQKAAEPKAKQKSK